MWASVSVLKPSTDSTIISDCWLLSTQFYKRKRFYTCYWGRLEICRIFYFMANNAAGRSAEILNAAANAITSITPRNPVPHQHRWWKGYWSRFWCFSPQKRTKRIVPAFRIQAGNMIFENLPNGTQQEGGVHQPTALSPLLLAPPSSPASFVNSGNPSTVPSPAGFISLSSMSANACSPNRPVSTMFETGPYAHETQLVSPPVFSTFSTEPSTAPFTPPPELSHLTNPSSPEVPFAQLLTSSSNTKATGQEDELTFSSFPFISSGYGATNDLLSAYQLYPGSPVGSLLSPRSGFSGSGPSSPFPDLEFYSQWKVLHSAEESFFPRNEHTKLFNHDISTSRISMFSQDPDSLCSATSAEFHLDHVPQGCQPFWGQSRIESFNFTSEAVVCCNSGNMEQERHMEIKKCLTNAIDRSSRDIRVIQTSQVEMEQEMNRASFELVTDEITNASAILSEVLADSFPTSSI